MKPLIKTILAKLGNVEVAMVAIPFFRCLVEGHEVVPDKGFPTMPEARFCSRCHLVYWVEL